jgi:predicted CXXCH cytochrome family protein
MRPAVPVIAMVAAAAIAALATFGLSRGEQGKVVGGQHDLGVTGVSACEVCHLPHDASGQPLWSDDPHAGDESFSGIAPACYSCHDGTVSDSGVHAFDVALAQHPVEPGEPGKDCDMCHDPHLADYGSFLLLPAGANLCRTCHAGGGSVGHPLNVDAAAMGIVPQDTRWDPDAGDFSGSRLWDEAGTGSGTLLKCLSCHAAHGTASKSLLSIPADSRGSNSLCANCHQW